MRETVGLHTRRMIQEWGIRVIVKIWRLMMMIWDKIIIIKGKIVIKMIRVELLM